MKTILLLVTIISFITISSVHSQSGELTIMHTNDGTVIEVSVFLRKTSAEPWSLGFASLVFNFNRTGMESPVEVYEGVWDNDSNSEYADQIITAYGTTAMSFEIGLNSLPAAGTTVPDIPALVGMIRFNIIDPLQFANITWNTSFSAILDNNGNNITPQIVFEDPPNAPLPVELESFTGIVRNNDVVLSWATTQETNNSGFRLERKKSDLEWQTAGFVNGNGNTNERKVYSFTDKNLQSGIYNYRLKQIDFNGNFTYFNLQNDINIVVPSRYELSQNYPNPFNPETVLRFSIPKLSKVRLSVYDIAGRKIVNLVNEELMPGNYEYKWIASDFSSGIYLYKLEADQFTETKRMTLLK